ncbi:HalOD1 output domain-containing protein [Haloterrigena gelatinilytica]|uniref:HalOD1 output domain-containing protein n=1 Tax=Haloterrigena gelatinilytica TaxID=2741724 RepID=UPI001C2E7EEE|nr:HalOD1 output domain-containing protein [Haloterrigena gelatinilytica]
MSNASRSIETAVSTRVIQRVAAVTDRTVAELPPLYETIDPEALDAVIDSAATDESALECQFTYSGCQVSITESGTVLVERDDR